MKNPAIVFGVLLFLVSMPVMVVTAVADAALFPIRKVMMGRRRAYYNRMITDCFADLDTETQDAVRACLGDAPTYDNIRRFAKEHALELGPWLRRRCVTSSDQIRAALLLLATNPHKDMR
jgi:hypothetical protein